MSTTTPDRDGFTVESAPSDETDGVWIVNRRPNGKSIAVGPLDPRALITAIRKEAGLDKPANLHPTVEDFAAVPWGEKAIPPEGGKYVGAVKGATSNSNPAHWIVKNRRGVAHWRSHSFLVGEGFTLPATGPAQDPWETLDDNIRAARATGVRSLPRKGERYIVEDIDGTLHVCLANVDHKDPNDRVLVRPNREDSQVRALADALGKTYTEAETALTDAGLRVEKGAE